ncbi:hypothetical protein ACQZV8_20860, partial [Magnetococcales bacterium HHB-1]
FADIFLSTGNRDVGGAADSGEGYVIFGHAGGWDSNIDLSTLDGSNGFTLSTGVAGDYIGRSISVVGDVNNDGIDDLAIGGSGVDWSGTNNVGGLYLVFGKSSGWGSNIDLTALNGSDGALITGYESTLFGIRSAGGDFNADGIDDILVSGSYADRNGITDSGGGFVLFGKETWDAQKPISSLSPEEGFWIDGHVANSTLGYSGVDALGDINGDGFIDLSIGSGAGDLYGGTNTGESYVIFGENYNSSIVQQRGTTGADTLTGTASADILIGDQGADTLVGSGGLDVLYGGEGDDIITVTDFTFSRIDGGGDYDTLDIDGSGLTLDLTTLSDKKLSSIESIDLTGSGNNTLVLDKLEVLNLSGSTNTLRIEGDAGDAVQTDGWIYNQSIVDGGVTYSRYTQGEAVLEINANIDQTAINGPVEVFQEDLNGTSGYSLSGPDASRFGSHISSAGDLNGDGFEDFLIGARYADYNGANAGAAYVLFGSSSGLPSGTDPDALSGGDGFRIKGEAAGDELGVTVSGGEDL